MDMIEYTYLWIIENYSFNGLKNGESLESPGFIAEDFESTTWYLKLYPKGELNVSRDYISLYLYRAGFDKGPGDYKLKFELSMCAADEMYCESRRFTNTFKKEDGYGKAEFVAKDLLFSKDYYLLKNFLRVKCKLWREYNTRLVKHITARTFILIEKISSFHEIESFSKLEPNEQKSVINKTTSPNGNDLYSFLYYSNDLCREGKIIMEIIPPDTKQFFTCQISLIDIYGNLIECGQVENPFDASIEYDLVLPLTITRQAILENKYEYLSNDKLSFKCEFIFSHGIKYSRIERTINGTHHTIWKQINEPDDDICHTAKRLKSFHNALDDFKTLYTDQLLSDVVLKTKTKSFFTHKTVLCARSCVFKAMLTNNMKEKNTNCIHIDDLDDETVEKLLLFLYSDKLETLQWKSAIKLYYTADKYEISRMKVLCSSFLSQEITVSNASELLVLADNHNDSKLKNYVEDFILRHEEEVFGSDEWGDFIEANSILASKTMQLKYKR